MEGNETQETNSPDSDKTDCNETDCYKTNCNKTDSNETDSNETNCNKTDSNETDSNETDSNKTDSNETDGNKTNSNETDISVEKGEIVVVKREQEGIRETFFEGGGDAGKEKRDITLERQSVECGRMILRTIMEQNLTELQALFGCSETE